MVQPSKKPNAKDIATLNQLKYELFLHETKGNWLDAINTCDKIVMLVKNTFNHEYVKEWKNKREELQISMKTGTNSSKEMGSSSIRAKSPLDAYLDLLRQANEKETTAPHESKVLLQQCLELIEDDERYFLLRFPNRVKDKEILKHRLQQFNSK